MIDIKYLEKIALNAAGLALKTVGKPALKVFGSGAGPNCMDSGFMIDRVVSGDYTGAISGIKKVFKAGKKSFLKSRNNGMSFSDAKTKATKSMLTAGANDANGGRYLDYVRDLTALENSVNPKNYSVKKELKKELKNTGRIDKNKMMSDSSTINPYTYSTSHMQTSVISENDVPKHLRDKIK